MNFLCISNYFNDLDWLLEYNNPHVIYHKTWNGVFEDIKGLKVIQPLELEEKYPTFNIKNGSQNGYNIYDYLSFIIENYENLPDVTAFIKGNLIGRHISKVIFDKLIHNKYFTCIEDWKSHDKKQRSLQNNYAMFSCDGGWMEKNTDWYLNRPNQTIKFFNSYNQFLSFCFKDPVYPKYIRFPPGANFIVPKENILKYQKIFYQNLIKFVEYSRLPSEAHILERALYTIWNCNFEVSESMKQPLDSNNLPSPEKLGFTPRRFALKLRQFLLKN